MKGTKTEISPGVWRLRVYVGRNAKGQPIQHSKTVRAPGNNPKPGAGVRLADSELAKMIAETSKGRTATGGETVSDLLDQWLEHLASRGRSPTTLREYHRLADKIVRPELGRVKLAKLTARDLDNLYTRLGKTGPDRDHGLKPASVRRVHALICAALHQAKRWQLVSENVALDASPPPMNSREIVAPDLVAVKRIIEAAEAIEPTLAKVLAIAALTGARRGELCALRWNDLDLQRGILTIARSVYEVAGGGWHEKDTKTHQLRHIPLDEVALGILRLHRDTVEKLAAEMGLSLADNAFMFCRSPAGLEPIRPDVLTKFTVRVAVRAGVPTHLHALRHFSATQGIALGYDVVTVSKRLGHRDPSVTLRVYSHEIQELQRDLSASLGKAIGGPALPRGVPTA